MIERRKGFAIHPERGISAGNLARLYGLELGWADVVVWDERRPETFNGRRYNDYWHLRVRSDGSYFKARERLGVA